MLTAIIETWQGKKERRPDYKIDLGKIERKGLPLYHGEKGHQEKMGYLGLNCLTYGKGGN